MNPIFERTSVRAWKDQSVETDKIDQLLKAAMVAPTAVNERPWEFYVVTDEKVKKELSEISPYSHFASQAPVLLAIVMNKDRNFPQYTGVDGGICVENIWLEATDLGLGTVCLAVYPEEDRMEKMAAILNLPPYMVPFALMPVGYPAKEPKPKDNDQPEKIHWIK